MLNEIIKCGVLIFQFSELSVIIKSAALLTHSIGQPENCIVYYDVSSRDNYLYI